MDAATRSPTAINEPVLDYAPGSGERASLEEALKAQAAEHVELTMTIAGEQRLGAGRPGRCGPTARQAPRSRRPAQRDARGRGGRRRGSQGSRPAWRALSFDDRAAVLLKAADLLAGPWRQTLNAATVLGQSKTCYQAEIDAACELIDFWRFNVQFGRQLLEEQPSGQRACGTGSTTGRSRASSTPSRRSTSPPSPATCRRRRRSWATPSCGSQAPRSSSPRTRRCGCSRRPVCRRRHQPGHR